MNLRLLKYFAVLADALNYRRWEGYVGIQLQIPIGGLSTRQA